MTMTVEETLTALEYALWVVDHAQIIDLPPMDDEGQTDPHFQARPPKPVTVVLEKAIGPSPRGVARVGLTVRLWLALLIVAAHSGHATIKRMHSIATGGLPREIKWELGILTGDANTGAVRELTSKQLYDMGAKITQHLDVDPARDDLTEEDRQERLALLGAVTDALVQATHALPHEATSYAVDESGVWAWVKGRKKPSDMPDIDPADEDAAMAADAREKAATGQLPDVEEPDDLPCDEDLATEPETQAHAVAEVTLTPEATSADTKPKRAPLVCWWANWGVKTHKSGRRSSYYGYALHALIRVPDVIKGGGKGPRTNPYAEPLLIEAFELTSASTDIVDVTLNMIKKTLARGHLVVDLLGDRHYSYKKFERWAAKLWALGVRPVLDLRKDDHGAVDYNGAQIIAGTPHCGVPDHLVRIERPGMGADQAEFDRFERQIGERNKYAMFRNKTAWQNRDGKTRWRCGARNGTVGCPRLPGSVELAHDNNLPVVKPPESELPWCKNDTVTIEPGPHMKYQQQEYWGLRAWLISWCRRTYVEGAFGNIKNHHTGNVHRGFMCFTGRPLVTLAITAAVVTYNLRELEHWHTRATENDPTNPLLDLYRKHPLHQRTKSQHGFTMLTEDQAAALDDKWATGGVPEPARRSADSAA